MRDVDYLYNQTPKTTIKIQKSPYDSCTTVFWSHMTSCVRSRHALKRRFTQKSPFCHHVVPNLHDSLSSVEYKKRYLEYIMEVNGNQKVISSVHNDLMWVCTPHTTHHVTSEDEWNLGWAALNERVLNESVSTCDALFVFVGRWLSDLQLYGTDMRVLMWAVFSVCIMPAFS